MSGLIHDRALTQLPRLEDSISYIYAEHCVIEQDSFSIAMIDKEGKTPVPIAETTCLLLGPGTSITHAAIRTISECGCSVIWCGERMRKYYAYGEGETKSSKNFLKQVRLWNENHLDVVRRMYMIRFPQKPPEDSTLEQLRGIEGVRVKQAYKAASNLYHVPWYGRNYKIANIDDSDDINRALTIANDLLYSVCQAAIVSLGYSPALGFIHTGHMRSFVYDIADVYKADITIPAAFEAVSSNPIQLDATVRACCRKRMQAIGLMKAIPKDIAWIFDLGIERDSSMGLWNGDAVVAQSKDYSKETK